MEDKRSSTVTNAVDRIASECLAVRMRLLNRAVSKLYDEALRPLGVKVSQLNVLVAVAKRGPVSPAQVGQMLHLEKSTLSRNLERMRIRGWIKVVGGEDGRSHSLHVTPKGEQLLEKVLPLWERAQENAGAVLGRSGVEVIGRVAGRLWSTGG